MERKNQAPLFDKEYARLAKAEKLLESLNPSVDEISREYADLTGHFECLLKDFVKICKISDINEKKMYRAKEELTIAFQDLEKMAGSYDTLSRANQELLDIDKLKSEFVATVSHELKTPLTAVCGYIDHLRSGRTGPLNEGQQRVLDSTIRSLRRLRRQITDLLDFSAIEAGKFSLAPAAFDLAELISEIAVEERPMVEAKNLTLEIDAPGPLPVTADRCRIGQVLENLIGNAVKFTSRGGLMIAAQAVGKGQVRVTVRDTGIGMQTEDIPKIFERFRQLDGSLRRRFGGVGLGLAIAQYILGAHDSKIEVESQPGLGAKFTFFLPSADSAAP